MTDTPSETVDRAKDLTAEYSLSLDKWINQHVPPMLTNSEYAARCSALMIALNRQLARCAAAFGNANEVDVTVLKALVHGQFDHNVDICVASLEGEGSSVQ